MTPTDPGRWKRCGIITLTVKVSKDGVSVTSNDSGLGNLRIIPSTHDWSTEIVKGQEEPTIQGWYSERYNQKEPNAAVIYSRKIPSSKTFGWLLLPAAGGQLALSTALLDSINESTDNLAINPKPNALLLFSSNVNT